MASPAAGPYRYGWLWAVLTILVVLGTVASATVVYGVTTYWVYGAWLIGSVVVVVGLVGALLSFLLLAGMLYRIDRLRGVPHRTVTLFE